MARDDGEHSKDTRRLLPEELSKDQMVAIKAIEERLGQAQKAGAGQCSERAPYLARAEDRHPRVLLIDGARGAGKTSFLLTLIERWHRHEAGMSFDKGSAKPQDFRDRAAELKVEGWAEAPDYVRVLPILDFDPLPPGVPLVAALVQAWRNIVKEYDNDLARGRNADRADRDHTLSDDWHKLFAMAAAGWGTGLASRGLIEQVLDQEEQLQDWHDFQHHWRCLIDKVVRTAQNLSGAAQKTIAEPVFVIVIDDCDLQVRRISELLPALRLLYHPRLFFIVAADRPHMIDMLALDFLGKQNRLAQPSAPDIVERVEWARRLAVASFEKVFSVRNRWLLRPLSLGGLLEFGIEGKSFKTVFEGWKSRTGEDVGSYFAKYSSVADDPALTGVMTARTAHQLLEQVLSRTWSAGDSADASSLDCDSMDAAEAIGRLLGRDEYESLVRVQPTGGSPNKPKVEYLRPGRLESYSVPEDNVDLTFSARLMLSAHPDFRYRVGSDVKRDQEPASPVLKMSAILAQSLQDDRFDVLATRQQWDARLGFVWTDIVLAEHELALAWPWYRHPSPLRLLKMADDWRAFLVDLQQQRVNKPERIAYAWIYFNLLWIETSDDTSKRQEFDQIASPIMVELNDHSWKALLSYQVNTKDDEPKDQWVVKTLAILARPEIGLHPDLQELLLANIDTPQKEWLRDQRRTLITEGIYVAAGEDRRRTPKDANHNALVNQIVREANKRHHDIYGKDSPWIRLTGDTAAG